MPSRNIVKEFAANQFYHIYSRGVAKQTVFLDSDDYLYFLGLLKRYLSSKPAKSKGHGPYPHFGKRMQLISYCLMSNHIHLLVYQTDAKAMTECMRALMTSYGMYFNHKYERVGPVFQSNYKASRISSDSYLQHISRYIHLNPREWQTYEYSSLPYFLGKRQAEWIQPKLIMDIFSNDVRAYHRFLDNYEEQKQILEELKWELADS